MPFAKKNKPQVLEQLAGVLASAGSVVHHLKAEKCGSEIAVGVGGGQRIANPSTLTLNFASLPEVSSDDEIMELLIVVID